MSDIGELLARLEAASEGTVELDRDIEAYLYPNNATLIFRDKWNSPPRTRSIEKALELRPEGWRWQVSDRAPAPHKGRAFINNGEPVLAGMGGGRNPAYRYKECTAATPAIAVCIVCLRALFPEAGDG